MKRSKFFAIVLIVRYFCDRHRRQYHPAFDDDDDDDDNDAVDDDNRDGAKEVQTIIVSSQYFSTITTKSKINITSTGSRYSTRKKVRAINLSYE